MDQNPDVIRHNIEATRSALTEKLETLECEVFGTVRETTTAVASTVQNVKDTVTSTIENLKTTVQDTKRSVKQSLDVRRQTARHPWVMFGGSFAAGLALGSLLPPIERLRTSTAPTPRPRASAFTPPRERERTGGFLGGLVQEFVPELDKVKGMAIGVVAGLIRDAIKERVPEAMVADVEELINSFTNKIGGHALHGPILETPTTGGDVPDYQRPQYASRY
jgi:ElaB/YqjD/DUF883 family membrane-anchored ribosome-binding protein